MTVCVVNRVHERCRGYRRRLRDITMSALPYPTDKPAPARLVWSIALPAMLTNIATALFGLADMWAIGRLGDPAAQGAVELGAKYMMGLLIVFNFLRTSTVALTAQAMGRTDLRAQADTLARATGVALVIGAGLLALMPLAIPLGLDLLHASGTVRGEAETYIAIRYWGGPLWLVNCVLVGWLIGQRRVRTVLAVEIAANVAHIGLDLLLVFGAGWGVAGVAVATLLSEALKLLAIVVVVARLPAARDALAAFTARATWRAAPLRKFFALNRDLFARTVLLTAAILIFTRQGAQMGPVTLAANGILFQLFMLATLLLDGFESASQVLCGEAMGARDRGRFVSTVRSTMVWGHVTALAVCAAYLVGGDWLAASFTTDPAVARTALRYTSWITLLPLVGISSFVLDGVFVGAGWTRAMLGTMLVALAIYLAALTLGHPLGNHGLWLAFTVLFVARAAGQFVLLPRLILREFSAS